MTELGKTSEGVNKGKTRRKCPVIWKLLCSDPGSGKRNPLSRAERKECVWRTVGERFQVLGGGRLPASSDRGLRRPA